MYRVPSFLLRAVRPLLVSVLALLGALSAPHGMAANPPGLAPAEGVLEILVEDHAKFARTRHFLKTANGRVELQFKGKPPSLRAGSRLRVKGTQSGNVMEINTTDSTAITVTATAPLPNTVGELKTAVLLVNFSDDRTRPFTPAQASDVMFSQVSSFMRENSAQKTWVSGNAFGWLELPIARTCDGGLIASQADAAAASAGIDLSAYGRVAYLFPENAVCGWGGSATLGGTRPLLWINGWVTLGVVGHEFGHTLGLYHSHSLDCGAATLGTDCTRYEYGDAIDIMGNRSAGHFSAMHKERLGWLAPTVANATGRYAIEAYAAPAGSLPKALKIRRGTDPTSGAALWYQVEYRRPVGFDAALAQLPAYNVLQGLVVRSVAEGDGNSSTWLDVTPGSSSWDDWADAALAFGQSYVDAGAGVTIVAVAGDGATAQLDVTFGPGACTRVAPALALTGPTQAVAAGTPLTYTLSVANRDNASCAAAAFDLRTAVPAGWSASLATASLTLGPGATGSTTLNVASPTTASAGAQTFSASAIHVAAPALVGSASATYTVAASTATASVATDKSSYRSGDTVTATARVISGGVPVAGASVGFVFTKSNGQRVAKTATTDAAGIAKTSYRIARKDPVGAWQVAGSSGAAVAAAAGFSVQ